MEVVEAIPVDPSQLIWCGVCHEYFIQPQELINHLRAMHQIKPYKCPDCIETFPTRFDLARHYRTDHLLFKCSECKRGFKKRVYLMSHLKVHSTDRPYKCPDCDKSFQWPSQRRSHIIKDH